MKKQYLLFVLLLFIISCREKYPKHVVIEVEGSPGVSYYGVIGSLREGQKSIADSVPHRYTCVLHDEYDHCFGYLNMYGHEGMISIRIFVNGKQFGYNETSTPEKTILVFEYPPGRWC